MRLLGSTGDTSPWRAGAEWTLRLVVVGLLAWSLVQMLRTRGGAAADVATSAALTESLARWSTVAAPGRVHVALDYPPPLRQRDWLAALPGVGTAVGWSGAALVPTAAAMEPIADPAGGADLAVAAPKDAKVELRDVLGPFDTVTAGAHGVRAYLPSPPALIEAAVGPVVAQAPLRDSLTLRRLLLLGNAGWEAKFVHAALEERGWKIDALLAFSPKGHGNINQGKIGAIDTATYAAVLAIDTVAARYADQITSYVRSGGGLVLWSEAVNDPAFAALAPGSSGTLLLDKGDVPTDSAPRLTLTLAPVTHLRADALVLERQRQQPAIAARRIGPGRVLVIGYVDAWRWRTAGISDEAPAAHRAWLARLVANVAYTTRRALPAPPGDPAPLATLIDRLGPAAAPERGGQGIAHLDAWIFGLLAAALILEWASRRLRGVQ